MSTQGAMFHPEKNWPILGI